MRTDDGTSAGTVKIKAVDARYPAASPGNVLAFTMHGASGAIACSALCAGKGEYPALNGAGGRAPSPAEVMQLMVNAARAGLDKQHGLDERAGRGFVRYPARAGEPERSGRRGYDDDGSAGDAAKYGDAHADDDDCGGYDDEDDKMSDFSGNNSDGQYGA